jgi:hypothetical protein
MKKEHRASLRALGEGIAIQFLYSPGLRRRFAPRNDDGVSGAKASC